LISCGDTSMTSTVSEGKKAAFEQQFACSGPASPPRETKVRAVIDGGAALEKFTTGGENFKSMTSAPPYSHARPPPLSARMTRTLTQP
jgi:hypothetical protein